MLLGRASVGCPLLSGAGAATLLHAASVSGHACTVAPLHAAWPPCSCSSGSSPRSTATPFYVRGPPLRKLHPAALLPQQSAPRRAVLARNHARISGALTALQDPQTQQPIAYVLGAPNPGDMPAADTLAVELHNVFSSVQQQAGALLLLADGSPAAAAADMDVRNNQHEQQIQQEQQQPQYAGALRQECEKIAAAYGLTLRVVVPPPAPPLPEDLQPQLQSAPLTSPSNQQQGLLRGLGYATRAAAVAALRAVEGAAAAAGAVVVAHEQRGVDTAADAPDISLRARRSIGWDSPEEAAMSWAAALSLCALLAQLEAAGYRVVLDSSASDDDDDDDDASDDKDSNGGGAGGAGGGDDEQDVGDTIARILGLSEEGSQGGSSSQAAGSAAGGDQGVIDLDDASLAALLQQALGAAAEDDNDDADDAAADENQVSAASTTTSPVDSSSSSSGQSGGILSAGDAGFRALGMSRGPDGSMRVLGVNSDGTLAERVLPVGESSGSKGGGSSSSSSSRGKSGDSGDDGLDLSLDQLLDAAGLQQQQQEDQAATEAAAAAPPAANSNADSNHDESGAGDGDGKPSARIEEAKDGSGGGDSSSSSGGGGGGGQISTGELAARAAGLSLPAGSDRWVVNSQHPELLAAMLQLEASWTSSSSSSSGTKKSAAAAVPPAAVEPPPELLPRPQRPSMAPRPLESDGSPVDATAPAAAAAAQEAPADKLSADDVEDAASEEESEQLREMFEHFKMQLQEAGMELDEEDLKEAFEALRAGNLDDEDDEDSDDDMDMAADPDGVVPNSDRSSSRARPAAGLSQRSKRRPQPPQQGQRAGAPDDPDDTSEEQQPPLQPSGAGWDQLSRLVGADKMTRLAELLRSGSIRMRRLEPLEVQLLLAGITRLQLGERLSSPEIALLLRLVEEADAVPSEAGAEDPEAATEALRRRARALRRQAAAARAGLQRGAGRAAALGYGAAAKDRPYQQDTRSARVPKRAPRARLQAQLRAWRAARGAARSELQFRAALALGQKQLTSSMELDDAEVGSGGGGAGVGGGGRSDDGSSASQGQGWLRALSRMRASLQQQQQTAAAGDPVAPTAPPQQHQDDQHMQMMPAAHQAAAAMLVQELVKLAVLQRALPETHSSAPGALQQRQPVVVAVVPSALLSHIEAAWDAMVVADGWSTPS